MQTNNQVTSTQITEDYRVLRLLGQGRDGSVYLALHIPTEQLRAAKRMPLRIGQSSVHELEMMKAMHHRGLPQVIDLIRKEDMAWLIMTYIPGEGLDRFCQKGLHPSEYFRIARELCEILLYLHTRPSPILHLDIKPSNLIIDNEGHLILLDFGASWCLRAGSPSEISGTRGFAAPEQYHPAAVLDVRTDEYSLGATLSWCLK